MKRLLFLSAIFASTLAVFGVGPKIPCWLQWDPSPSPDVTGYFFYWRTTNGVYADTQRIPLTMAQQPYDLRVLNLAKGDYFVMMTATNTVVSGTNLVTGEKIYQESDPSSDFLWRYSNPNKPGDLSIQAQ